MSLSAAAEYNLECNQETMKVSVAIPCYNGAAYLANTLEAVLAQTRPPDEVLVIDDGSTDQSAQIGAHYPVRLIQHSQNLGLSAGRNSAIEAATGEILAFVDVDATADSTWLETLLAEYTDASVMGVGGAGIESNIHSTVDRWRQLHASQHHGQKRLERVDFLFGLNMSFRREALLRVGKFDTRLRTNAEDMDMGYRLNDAGYRLVYQPQARVYHQRRDSLDSLKRAIYHWYYWAFLIKKKNGRQPWSLAAGTLRRLLWSDTWPDLLLQRSLHLSHLNLLMAAVKTRALMAAAQAGF